MKGFRDRLHSKNRFVRSVAVLTSGIIAGQAIVVLASPILTRLYTPEEYGVLGVYAAILSIVTVVASLRYQLAIPLPRSDGSAANILALSLICIAGITACTGLLVFLFGDFIILWTNTPVLEPYLWLLPMGVALGGSYQAFNYWAVRKRAFSRIARTRFQQSGGMVATQISLGLAQMGSVGLILGQVLGQTAGLTSLVYGALREDRAALERIRSLRIRWAARRYRYFPIYSTWSALVDKAGSQLPLVLFAALFSPAVAGLYFLAHRVLKIPVSLLGQAIGQVFYSSAAEAQREKRLDIISSRIFSGLVRIGLGPMVLVAINAPELFAFLFGAEWREAGVYVQWMTPWLVMVFVASPLSNLVSVMERQAQGLIFQLSLFVLRSTAIVIGAHLGGALLAIALYSITGFLVWAVFAVWLLHITGVAVAQWFQIIIKEITRVFPLALALWWISKQLLIVDPGQMGSEFVLICTGLAIGGVLLWRVLPFISSPGFKPK